MSNNVHVFVCYSSDAYYSITVLSFHKDQFAGCARTSQSQSVRAKHKETHRMQ